MSLFETIWPTLDIFWIPENIQSQMGYVGWFMFIHPIPTMSGYVYHEQHPWPTGPSWDPHLLYQSVLELLPNLHKKILQNYKEYTWRYELDIDFIPWLKICFFHWTKDPIPNSSPSARTQIYWAQGGVASRCVTALGWSHWRMGGVQCWEPMNENHGENHRNRLKRGSHEKQELKIHVCPHISMPTA